MPGTSGDERAEMRNNNTRALLTRLKNNLNNIVLKTICEEDFLVLPGRSPEGECRDDGDADDVETGC